MYLPYNESPDLVVAENSTEEAELAGSQVQRAARQIGEEMFMFLSISETCVHVETC